MIDHYEVFPLNCIKPEFRVEINLQEIWPLPILKHFWKPHWISIAVLVKPFWVVSEDMERDVFMSADEAKKACLFLVHKPL